MIINNPDNGGFAVMGITKGNLQILEVKSMKPNVPIGLWFKCLPAVRHALCTRFWMWECKGSSQLLETFSRSFPAWTLVITHQDVNVERQWDMRAFGDQAFGDQAVHPSPGCSRLSPVVVDDLNPDNPLLHSSYVKTCSGKHFPQSMSDNDWYLFNFPDNK